MEAAQNLVEAYPDPEYFREEWGCFPKKATGLFDPGACYLYKNFIGRRRSLKPWPATAKS